MKARGCKNFIVFECLGNPDETRRTSFFKLLLNRASLGTGQKVRGGGIGPEHFKMWWLENT